MQVKASYRECYISATSIYLKNTYRYTANYFYNLDFNIMDNKTLILNEFEKLKGQFVITMMMKVQRLVAIAEDETDYYYITYDGRKLIWNTCCGRIIPLKGKLNKKHYNELERMASLNDYDRLITESPNENTVKILNEFKVSLLKDFRPGIDNLLTDIIFKDDEFTKE